MIETEKELLYDIRQGQGWILIMLIVLWLTMLFGIAAVIP